ncbi:hypothetical protein D6C84_10401 [Aureobasidium pullulans]|uniref:histidine kinase n=1 Tax=Aureobasidium pullulans TaxID=5580 RepID=A0A4S9WWX4_AURPU|nr:hypothetical protein D6C84_10401 [Aureobasidium pullulans]
MLTANDMDMIHELVSTDDRPTFILDSAAPAQIIFKNAAFDKFIAALAPNTPLFESWLPSVSAMAAHAVSNPTFMGVFGGRHWTGKSLDCGWTVVFCKKASWTTSAHKASCTHGLDTPSPSRNHANIASAEPHITHQLIDWTINPSLAVDPWTRYLVNDYPWQSTAIGPIVFWPSLLRSHAVSIMSNPQPRCIFWGSDFKMIYNGAWVRRLGEMHGTALGNPVAQGGQGLHDYHYQQIRHTMKHGMAATVRDVELLLPVIDGRMEETYHNSVFTPITQDDGYCAGFMFEYEDTTPTVYKTNRDNVIANITQRVSRAESLDALWSIFVDALHTKSDDVSYAMLYTVNRQAPITGSSDDHLAPPVYSLHTTRGIDTSRFGPTASTDLESVFSSLEDNIILLESRGSTLPSGLSVDTPRGLVFSAYVIPVTSNLGAHLAHVVIGMNPRRPIDENRTFVTSLQDLFVRSVAVVCLPEERRMVEDANFALLDQLRLTRVKAEKNAETFERMGRNAPAGMFIYDGEGNATYANDACLKLFGMTSAEWFDASARLSAFRRVLSEQDHDYSQGRLQTLFTGATSIDYSFQVKQDLKTVWVEGIAFAERDETGNLVSVQGWVSDVSHRKFAESIKDERLQEALANKEAADRFVDMVSHEVRNPLSSMLLLVETILSVLPSETSTLTTLAPEDVATILSAAQTIALCIHHQKNIVNDVLELSKLDSNLMELSFESSRPLDFLERNLQMFSADLMAAKIESLVQLLPSYQETLVGAVLMDSSKMTQVLVNLLTNAIKFTRDTKSNTRKITISLGASSSRPTGSELGVHLVPLRDTSKAKVDAQLLGTHEADALFLHCSVADTGCGLTPKEISHLFERFSQASPKTHKQYGGSGLGLFIARELIELHSGQIGVKGEPDVGSTFTFYIKVYREPPTTAKSENVQPEANGRGTTRRKSSTQPSGRKATFSIKNLHIHLVEDNLITLKVMKLQLLKAGCKFLTTSENGQQALDDLATSELDARGDSEPVSIILLDCEMPIMDGLTCARRIRELERIGDLTRHIPIIAITANARPQQINNAIDAGMDEVVTKPFDMVDLVDRVEALIRKWPSRSDDRGVATPAG